MVPVDGWLSQNGRKIRKGGNTVLTCAGPPLRCEQSTVSAARRCARSVVLARAYVQAYKGHVAILRDHVGKVVELVTDLEVVCARPAALEKCNIFIKLVVLAGVVQRVAWVEWRGACPAG